MDLTAALLRTAARRPHVLVVPAVGGTAVRLRLEAEFARRGWPAATGPADTDVLVVAGVAGPALTAVVERVWAQVPAPRVRVGVGDPDRVAARLDEAVGPLADAAYQRRTAVAASDESPGTHTGHAAAAGHGGHHDHHGGAMELPGGRAMADLAADRDGLTLDRLHVPLGPLLPDWPAGLVLRVTLQGDVIQEAAAEVLDREHGRGFWQPGDAAARELDGLARFLAVAGWAPGAARARALRDQLLDGVSAAELAEPVEALVRRVRRSRTLRWLISGIPAGETDVAGVLNERLDAVLDGEGPARLDAGQLPELLVGAELAAARLVVAVLDPDTEPTPVQEAAGHG